MSVPKATARSSKASFVGANTVNFTKGLVKAGNNSAVITAVASIVNRYLKLHQLLFHLEVLQHQ
jgi:hypothetical protein